MRVFRGVDELAAAVGADLGTSQWHPVTQEQVDRFAEATGDHQWIHVDPVRAAEGPFGTTIAHGYLTLSLVPLLAAEVYAVEGVRLALNYGCNKVRFPTPVPVGSRVRGSVVLDSVTTVVDARHVLRLTYRDQDDNPSDREIEPQAEPEAPGDGEAGDVGSSLAQLEKRQEAPELEEQR